MTHTGIVVKEKQLPLNLQCLQKEKENRETLLFPEEILDTSVHLS